MRGEKNFYLPAPNICRDRGQPASSASRTNPNDLAGVAIKKSKLPPKSRFSGDAFDPWRLSVHPFDCLGLFEASTESDVFFGWSLHEPAWVFLNASTAPGHNKRK